MVMGVKLAFMWKLDALCAISKPKGHERSLKSLPRCLLLSLIMLIVFFFPDCHHQEQS